MQLLYHIYTLYLCIFCPFPLFAVPQNAKALSGAQKRKNREAAAAAAASFGAQIDKKARQNALTRKRMQRMREHRKLVAVGRGNGEADDEEEGDVDDDDEGGEDAEGESDNSREAVWQEVESGGEDDLTSWRSSRSSRCEKSVYVCTI